MRTGYSFAVVLMALLCCTPLRAAEKPRADFARRAADPQEPLFLVSRWTQAQGRPAARSAKQLPSAAANPASRPSFPAIARRANCSAASPATDDDEVMPPEGERLSSAQVKLLREWIEAGAVWPDALAGDEALETPLGVPAAGASAASGREECEVGAQLARSLRAGPAGNRRD